MKYYLSPTHGPHVGDAIYPDDQEHPAEGFEAVAAAWYSGADERELARIAARKASLVAEVHALREERFRQGFMYTDGHRYPLDLGAQVSYHAQFSCATLKIKAPYKAITVDNIIIERDADAYIPFALTALSIGDQIVIKTRLAKDLILNAETIESAEVAFEAYRCSDELKPTEVL